MSLEPESSKRRWAFETWWRPRAELAEGEQQARVPDRVRKRYRRELDKALNQSLRRLFPAFIFYLLIPLPFDFLMAPDQLKGVLVARLTAITGLLLIGWPTLRGRPVQKPTALAVASCVVTVIGASTAALLTSSYQIYLLMLLPFVPAMLPVHRSTQLVLVTGCGGTVLALLTITMGREAVEFLPLVIILLLTAWLIGRTQGRLRARSFLRAEQLRREAMAADSLLKLILPENAAKELLEKGRVEPTRHEEVTILFADLVGFARIAEQLDGVQLVQELDDLFTEFDRIAHRFGLERIKTIGDAYMAVAGLDGQSKHAERAVTAGEEMIAYLESRPQFRPKSPHWTVRVGAHSGPVVSGILGGSRLVFDIWGDTVNVAARMESTSEPGKINVSSRTNALLQGVDRQSRGRLAVKNRGDLTMFFVTPKTELPTAHKGDN